MLWNAGRGGLDDGHFVYARAIGSAYELELIPAEDVPHTRGVAPQQWVTIDNQALTFHTRGEAEDSAVEEQCVRLDDWIRERRLFLRLRQLPTFKQFLKRRLLEDWRRGKERAVVERSSRHFLSAFLMQDRRYQEVAQWVQAFCLANLRTLCIWRGAPPEDAPSPAVAGSEMHWAVAALSLHREAGAAPAAAAPDAPASTATRRSLAVFRELHLSSRMDVAWRLARLERELHEGLGTRLRAILDEVIARALGSGTSTLMKAKHSRKANCDELSLGIPVNMPSVLRSPINTECARLWRLVRLCDVMLESHLVCLCKEELARLCTGLRSQPELAPADQRGGSSSAAAGAAGAALPAANVFVVEVMHDLDKAAAAKAVRRPRDLRLRPSLEEVRAEVLAAALGGTEALQLVRRPAQRPDFRRFAAIAGLAGGEGDLEDGVWPCYHVGELLFRGEMATMLDETVCSLTEAFEQAEGWLRSFHEPLERFFNCSLLNYAYLRTTADPAEKLINEIRRMVHWHKGMVALQEKVDLGMIELDMTSLVTTLRQATGDRIEELSTLLPPFLGGKVVEATTWAIRGLDVVSGAPSEAVPGFMKLLYAVRQLVEEAPAMSRLSSQLRELFEMAAAESWPLPKAYGPTLDRLEAKLVQLSEELKLALPMVEGSVPDFARQVKATARGLLERIDALRTSLASPALMSLAMARGVVLEPGGHAPSRLMLQLRRVGWKITFQDEVEEADVIRKQWEVDELGERYAELAEEVEEHTRHQEAFLVEDDSCQQSLADAHGALADLRRLWAGAAEWRAIARAFAQADLHALDPEVWLQRCSELAATLSGLGAAGGAVCDEMLARAEILRALLEDEQQRRQQVQEASQEDREGEEGGREDGGDRDGHGGGGGGEQYRDDGGGTGPARHRGGHRLPQKQWTPEDHRGHGGPHADSNGGLRDDRKGSVDVGDQSQEHPHQGRSCGGEDSRDHATDEQDSRDHATEEQDSMDMGPQDADSRDRATDEQGSLDMGPQPADGGHEGRDRDDGSSDEQQGLGQDPGDTASDHDVAECGVADAENVAGESQEGSRLEGRTASGSDGGRSNRSSEAGGDHHDSGGHPHDGSHRSAQHAHHATGDR